MTDDAQERREQVAGLYNRVAATYGKIGPDLFAPFGRDLVARMNLSPGAQVLDVATGRGAVLFAAAEQVGSAGFVVGIDVAEQMVQETAADLRERQMTNATVQQMDAEHLAFPSASFDAVLCSHALPLFPQVERALAEFHLIITLPLIVFWLWMAWDLGGNDHLSSSEKFYWMLAFIFMNVFAAVFYYVYEYRKRH